MEELKDYREKLDSIDDKIAALYNERMRAVKEIALIKAKNGVKIADSGREKAIISRVTKEVDADKRILTKQLFNAILDTSKAYQSRYIAQKGDISTQIEAALSDGQTFPEYATVACQGIEGAYSSLAAEKLFPLSDLTFVKDFDGVFNAVEKGLCEYGILPIENSSVGSVNAVYDLMKKHKFYIVKSVKLGIKHNLLALDGVKKEDITEVYSHEQALNQCKGYLKTLFNGNVKLNVVENTAVAAKIVSDSGRRDVAAISSFACADLYGLSVIEKDVEDSVYNYTRFICISKQLRIFNNADKISLMIDLPHETGSLNKLLSKFTALGLNLTKLESRPQGASAFEFMFYFDFDADIKDEEVRNLLSELSLGTDGFTFLGSYSEL